MLRRRPIQENDKKEEDKFASATEKKRRSSSIFFKLVVMLLFITYIVIPLSVYFCPAVRRHAVFLHYVSLSRQKNLSLPEESGLTCTRNFYVNSGDNVKLGVWHIPPASALSRCQNGQIAASEEFKDNQPVFLYLHGNAGTRGGGHRVQLYKVISEKLNAHVIAFDYRGYGDSSNVSPSESGLVEDTQHVYEWLLKHVNPSRIFVWGHSLGTGVGVAFLHRLSSSLPAALILEAPFTRIIDAAKHHPLSIIHRYMPFFDALIAKPIGDKDTGFDSISRINQVKCPILILHAEDDGFVPFEHGKELYEVALKTRKNTHPHNTQFVAFDGKLDFGHKNIYKSPELPNIIKQFMNKMQDKKNKV
uniref:Putative monoacylglycerol lipase n=1 Tax=Cupiennius salei TaxID=6928 RepID=T1E1Q2_CUPSA